jgi:glutamine synthetase
MADRQEKPEDILAALAESDATKVKLAVSDVDGILRGKYLDKDKFLAAVEDGLGFCDVVLGWDCCDECYDNVAYTGWHTGYPDAQVRVDLSTHRRIPWENDVDFFLCEFVDKEKKDSPLEECPRQLLKKVVTRIREAGFEPKVGFEFEWFCFSETPQSLAKKDYRDITTLTPGMFGYSILRAGQNHDYLTALMDQLAGFGVPLEGIHTETGPGTFEASLLPTDPLEAADRAILFKTGVKQLGYPFGIIASFMARWNDSLPGCGGHIHQSLSRLDDGASAFFDSAAPNKMTPLFESYLAGQLQYTPEFLALLAPTVNSYKRLVEGYWAPTAATWGYDNRTVAFRVIPGTAQSARVEGRVSGADINPYLALAASLAAGFYGVEKELTLSQAPVAGNGYADKEAAPLPRTLGEAAEALAVSAVARELFGDAFVDHFANTRRWEWRQAQQAVTDWELKRYLEII